jgi:hypothetical protein
MGDLKRDTEQQRQLGIQAGPAEGHFQARRQPVKQ